MKVDKLTESKITYTDSPPVCIYLIIKNDL